MLPDRKNSKEFRSLFGIKQVCIPEDIQFLHQSSVCINKLGKMIICGASKQQKQNEYITIQYKRGDSYHWVYPWQNGFIIQGNIHLYWIDSKNNLSLMKTILERLLSFPLSEQLFTVQKNDKGLHVYDLKNRDQPCLSLPKTQNMKFRSKGSLQQPWIEISKKQSQVIHIINMKTKQQQILKFPNSIGQFLKIGEDNIIYLMNTLYFDSMELFLRNTKKQKDECLLKLEGSDRLRICGLSKVERMIGLQDGYRVQIIKYDDRTTKKQNTSNQNGKEPPKIKKNKLSSMLGLNKQDFDIEVMGANMQYFCLMKNNKGNIRLACYKYMNQMQRLRHIFSKSGLTKLYGNKIMQLIQKLTKS